VQLISALLRKGGRPLFIAFPAIRVERGHVNTPRSTAATTPQMRLILQQLKDFSPPKLDEELNLPRLPRTPKKLYMLRVLLLN
jgi:hypothetical protein